MPKTLYLIYACLGVFNTCLILLLKETIGVIQPTNIIEMENKQNENNDEENKKEEETKK